VSPDEANALSAHRARTQPQWLNFNKYINALKSHPCGGKYYYPRVHSLIITYLICHESHGGLSGTYSFGLTLGHNDSHHVHEALVINFIPHHRTQTGNVEQHFFTRECTAIG